MDQAELLNDLINLLSELVHLNKEEINQLNKVEVKDFSNEGNQIFCFVVKCFEPLDYSLVDKISDVNAENLTVKVIINEVTNVNNNDYKKLIDYISFKNHDCFKMIGSKFSYDSEKKLVIFNDLNNLEQKILDKYVHLIRHGFIKYLGIKIDFDNRQTKDINQTIKNKQKESFTSNNRTNLEVPKLDNDIVSLNELTKSMDKVNVIGEVFHIDIHKAQKVDIYTYYINDYHGTYILKWIDYNRKNNKFIETLTKIKQNDWIKANISIRSDNSETNDYGYINKIEIIQKPTGFCRSDNYDQKRIELMMHTKMSAFDGINNVDEVFALAKQFDMPAIGFSDRYNIQSFPEIQKYSKQYGIKPIYGCEIEVLPNICKCIINENDEKITDQTFVIFDLETTGLYPAIDDIIEFGALKLKNNKVIDRTQFFIKPNKLIPEKIVEITNISNEMVANSINQEEGIKQIVNYIDGCVLIAHNGINFDFPFLNKKAEIYLNKTLNNPVIDTLPIARALFPNWKTHRLEKLCNELAINYLSQEAHRADYDAEVLFMCWNKLLDMLHNQQIFKLNEINKLTSPALIGKYTSDMMVMYAKNNDSLKVINQLISSSHTKNFFTKPLIFKDDLDNKRENLIIVNSPIDGEIMRLSLYGTNEQLKSAISFYDYVFICPPSDLLHLMHHHDISLQDLELITKNIIDLAIKQNKKVIAVNNSYYLNPWDKKFHYVYLHAKGIGGQRHRYYKFDELPNSFLKTTQEMLDAFKFLNNEKLTKEIVIDNSNYFNEQISNEIFPIKDKLFTPKMENVDNLIVEKVYETAKLKYGSNLPDIVKKRLQKELDSILTHQFSVIYWISHLLVQKSYSEGYVVGSRGSVGSSLVATMLKITDVNPLAPHYICPECHHFELVDNIDDGFDLEIKKCPECGTIMIGDGHNIPFETFLGFKCDKVPDIDLNFSGLYQAKAHEFIREMFGKDHAFRAGTISTIASKTSYGYVKAYFDEIGKLNVSKTDLSLYAKKCEDVKRTTGQHPGGILIVPSEYSIYDFSPFNFPADDTSSDWYTTHYAFEYLHDNLLKFDILGHDNPTILRMLKDLTHVDEKDIPNHDENVIKLFTSTKPLKFVCEDYNNEKNGCLTIPEFGTKFVREMLNDTQPKSFSDLIRISGLSHGTNVYLDNAKSLIKSHGLKLKDTIACRDDVMIFLISKGIENSIAFKIMEDVRKGKGLKPEYVEIMKQHGVEQWYIDSCNKIAYIFPKAHATAYVMHAWKFAWYKIYYPLEYYATFLSIKSDAFDIETVTNGMDAIKVRKDDINKRLNDKKTMHDVKKKETDLLSLYEICLEIYARGFKIEKPNILNSLASEFVIKDKSLIIPFSCIDGIGYDVAVSIIKARDEKPFSSIDDLLKRTKLNKTSIEILKKLGALDSLPKSDQMRLFDI